MATITLLTGGSRSGKSAHALELAAKSPGRKFFLATAEALDSEMRARIESHRQNRPPEFTTVEEPLHPAEALSRLSGLADVVVLDCLTLWVSNQVGAGMADGEIRGAAERLAATLTRASFESIVVTDEVGSGIVPDNPLGRRFRDLLGQTNQKIAAVADTVLLMVAGCPIRVK